MPVAAYTYEERPDLAERSVPSADVWPEYNLHGDVLNRYWGALAEELPDFQMVLYDDGTDEVLADLNTGTLTWDGEDAHLLPGIDAVIVDVVEGRRSGAPRDTLCALAAKVAPSARGRGLAEVGLEAMRALAARHGYRHLVAPVRPSWKERYPLAPIDRYARWRRPDGELLDPWLRVHERAGGRLGPPLPRSLLITGAVGEWEAWTEMAFPESGSYVFPRGLAPLEVDREHDRASYWEPNVWMVHEVGR